MASMGRHSDGKQNYRIARGPLLALLALIIVMALVLGWWQLRSDTAANRADDKSCPAGDLTLPIKADPAVKNQVQEMVQKYQATNPMVQEHCIKPEVTAEPSAETLALLRKDTEQKEENDAPAVWVPAGTSYAAAAKDSGVAVEATGPDVASVPIGFAVSPSKEAELKQLGWPDLGKLKIAAAGGQQAAVSGAVLAAAGVDEKGAEQAATLSGGKDISDVLAGLGEKYDAVPATQEQASASGMSYVSPDGLKLPGPVLALTPSSVTPELDARAAKSFADYAKKSGFDEVDANNPPNGGAATTKLAAAVNIGAGTVPKNQSDAKTSRSDGKSKQSSGQLASTLFLLDTSGSMGLVEGDATRMEHTQKLVVDELKQAGKDGGRVGLWNYSSPQSEGVTQPWRDNIPLNQNDNGDQSAQSLSALGIGGATWTYSSVLAAYESATNAYVDGGTNRIILLTDGPDDSGMTPEDFLAQLAQLQDSKRPVQVDVVLLGDKIDPAVFEELTTKTGGELYKAAKSDSPEFADAVKKAFQG